MKNKGFFSQRRARLPAPFKVNCAESLLLQKRQLKAGYCCKARGGPLSTAKKLHAEAAGAACGPGGRSAGVGGQAGTAGLSAPVPPPEDPGLSHSLGVAQRV